MNSKLMLEVETNKTIATLVNRKLQVWLLKLIYSFESCSKRF